MTSSNLAPSDFSVENFEMSFTSYDLLFCQFSGAQDRSDITVLFKVPIFSLFRFAIKSVRYVEPNNPLLYLVPLKDSFMCPNCFIFILIGDAKY